MRNEKLLTAAVAVLVAFLVSFGCIGCIVTGLDMAVDLATVALWCGVAAFVSGIFFQWKLDFLPLGGVAATGIYLWVADGMELSLRAVVYRFSRKYNAQYGWGVIRPLHYTADMLEPELWLLLCFVGAVLAVLIAWGFCRKKTALPGVALALVCVGSCFLVRGTVPDPIWLWMCLFGLLLLILSQTNRRKDVRQGSKLAVMAAVPLAIFLLLLFALIPQENYSADAPAKTVTDTVLRNPVFQSVFGDLTQKPGTVISTGTNVVNLGAVGPQYKTQDEVLRIETNFSGRVYLRNRSFDLYNGRSWEQSKESEYLTSWPGTESLEPLGAVTVTTRFAHKMLYVPYYVQNMPLDATGFIDNANNVTEYTYFVYKTPSESQLASSEIPYSLIDGVNAFDWNDKLAYKITKNKETVYEKAQAIADYVRNSAQYDLQTQKVPANKEDFVRWFLEDSETGYCVHFASATAVLLQKAGIPARYVNGYMVDAKANETTVVYTSDAHAWVEYWLPGFGWTVLESTPAAVNGGEDLTQQDQENTVSGAAIAIIGAAALLVAILAVFIQRTVRLHLRRKRLHSGSVKERVLAHWQEAVRFANCLEETPGEGLLATAEKAKFSNHILTEDDLEPFYVYLDSARQRIRNHGLGKKLYYRFVLALY